MIHPFFFFIISVEIYDQKQKQKKKTKGETAGEKAMKMVVCRNHIDEKDKPAPGVKIQMWEFQSKPLAVQLLNVSKSWDIFTATSVSLTTN